jgi:hypothetical protein
MRRRNKNIQFVESKMKEGYLNKLWDKKKVRRDRTRSVEW